MYKKIDLDISVVASLAVRQQRILKPNPSLRLSPILEPDDEVDADIRFEMLSIDLNNPKE